MQNAECKIFVNDISDLALCNQTGLAHLEIMGQSLSLSYGNPAPFTQGSL